MYPVLAIDTCLGAVSAALEWRDADGRAQISADWETCRGGHAERLMPMIAALLAEAGVSGRDLRRIAVTLGPGTFTGVRTGIAVARGLALASGAEIVGTTSLAAIAAGLAGDPPGARIAIAVDARKGDVFLQLFETPRLALGQPLLLPLATAAAHLAGHRWRIVGSAAPALAKHATTLGCDVVETQDTAEPDAVSLLMLAQTLAPLTSATPLYIRPPDALPQSGKSLPRADA
jgi:tRNA threonylcarbamoyladenosine biosynthesis protein TsaB